LPSQIRKRYKNSLSLSKKNLRDTFKHKKRDTSSKHGGFDTPRTLPACRQAGVLGASRICTPCYAPPLILLQGPLFKALALKQGNGTKTTPVTWQPGNW